MSELPVPSTIEVSKTSISLALTKAGVNYQKNLQEAENVAFSKDDLPAGKLKLEEIKKLKSAIEDQTNPHTAAWKAWNDAKASLLKPVVEVLARKTKAFTTANDEVKAANTKLAMEELRKSNIHAAISVFTLDYSTKIAATTTTDQLVALQKRIGAEKSRSGYYQEFMPNLIAAVEGLENAIKSHKEQVRQLEALQEKKLEAEAAGDDEGLVEILEKQAAIGDKIQDTKTEVQEMAINQSTAFQVPDAEVVLPETAKPARTTWEFEIKDMALFSRRNPELVEVTPKTKKIEAILKERKENKTIKAVEEDGWRIYQKEHF